MSIIYIAGKMQGAPGLNKERFCGIADMLRLNGHTVLNPAELPPGLPRDRYMPICLAMLGAADIVYAMNNWESSPGAAVEVNFAKYQGKKIWYEKVWYEKERDAASADV